MPKTNETKKKKEAKNSNTDSDNEEKDSHDYSFILRQEANERKRIIEREFQKGKKDYDALVDKKYCPNCKATQSYDEVKEKRKNCPNCQIPYAFKTDWSKVQNQFYKRQNDAYVNHLRALELKKKEVVDKERKSMRLQVDHETGEIFTVEGDYGHDLKWTRDVEDDFFTRMEESETKRQMNIKKLDEEIYGQFQTNFKRRNKSSAQSNSFYFTEGGEIDTNLYYS